jgi:hypothetical protein
MAGSIPREVLSEHFQERLAGKRLVGALFLTFEFDPGFFEQEVLPVILDTPVSHTQVPRLLQLEDALRSVDEGVAVFYDWSGLRASSYTAPRLDIARLPVRVPSGIFHPKNVLLLTEDLDPDDEGTKRERLLVATLSANLTRSGWWENVEACHIEELEAGSATRLKDALLALIGRLERLTANEAARDVLGPYRQFLNGLEQAATKSKGGWLASHFYVNGGGQGDDLAAFLKAHIPRGSGYRMEVISPFFDAHGTSSPLTALEKALQPDEIRVFLPHDASGVAQCSAELFDYVQSLGDHVNWAALPDDMLGLGRSAEAGRRSVHAKVYRVFKPHPKTEYVFVGSVNLTAPGHSGSGGNVETGVLVQVEPPSRPDFWLRSLKGKPKTFKSARSEDDAAAQSALPVQVRFSWKTREASVRWDGDKPVPLVTLLGTGGPLGEPIRCAQRAWKPLPATLVERLASELTSTSIVTARTDEGGESILLVQEEDMPLKPELARTLPLRDILHYWSLLKPDQRQAFLESRAQQLSPGELEGLMAPLDDGAKSEDDIFERCAGIFHAFTQLEGRVHTALEEKRSQQAAALVFGERFDSLRTVLDRVVEGAHPSLPGQEMTPVDRYLVLLCAVQVCEKLRKDAREFWDSYHAQAQVVLAKLEERAALRVALCAGDHQMAAFMDWFDHWFLRRAEPVVQP